MERLQIRELYAAPALALAMFEGALVEGPPQGVQLV
jgi:hypothetical protein